MLLRAFEAFDEALLIKSFAIYAGVAIIIWLYSVNFSLPFDFKVSRTLFLIYFISVTCVFRVMFIFLEKELNILFNPVVNCSYLSKAVLILVPKLPI